MALRTGQAQATMLLLNRQVSCSSAEAVRGFTDKVQQFVGTASPEVGSSAQGSRNDAVINETGSIGRRRVLIF